MIGPITPAAPPLLGARLGPLRSALLWVCFAAAPAARAAPSGPPAREVEPPADLLGQPQGFGLGLAAGDPTGLAFSVRKQREQAINGVIGWSFVRDWLSLTTDWTRTLVDLQSESTPELRYPVYAGLGLSARLGGGPANVQQSTVQVGVRAPVGIMLQPTRVRLDLAVEVAPSLRVVPTFGFGFDATLVARYYLGAGSRSAD